MDARLLYSEMRRVLKPTGALAIWGYGLHSFPPALSAGNVLLQVGSASLRGWLHMLVVVADWRPLLHSTPS